MSIYYINSIIHIASHELSVLSTLFYKVSAASMALIAVIKTATKVYEKIGIAIGFKKPKRELSFT